MRKSYWIFSVVFVSVLAISTFAWAAVVGTWNIDGTVKVTVTIKKDKPPTTKETVSIGDYFLFESDYDFFMEDMAGTWVYTDKKQTKFEIMINDEDIVTYFMDIPTLASATVTSFQFKGKENKDGTISGTFKMKMDFVLTDTRVGKVQATGSYTGVKAPSTAPLAFGEKSSFLQAVLEKVVDVLSAEKAE